MAPRDTAEPTFILAPIDQGIRNVGGRDGARLAPEALLSGLEARGRLTDKARVTRVEAANTADSLEADLDRLSEVVQAELEAGRLPVVLGGDHGTSYATVRGAARALGRVGVAYLDVHLDVRSAKPRHTSGSSFRRLVEEGLVDPGNVRGLGIQRPEDPATGTDERASFSELKAWADEQGLAYRWLEELKEDPAGVVQDTLTEEREWCFSIDVDVVDRRWALGVSAPGQGRLSHEQALEAARAARGRYRVLDIVECSPSLDEDERTLETSLDLLEAALPERG